MTITLEHIKHDWVLKDCLRVSKVYKQMLDGIPLDDYVPDFYACVWFQAELDNEPAGVVMIKMFSPNCVAIHAGIYEKFRHKNSSNYLKEIMEKIRGQNTWQYVSMTGVKNKPAQKVLEKTGFIHKATIPNGYKTDDLMIYSEV